MRSFSLFLRAAQACLFTLGIFAAAFAFIVSGGLPKAYEVKAMREALGSAYVQTLERVEDGARRLRENYCGAQPVGDPDCALASVPLA